MASGWGVVALMTTEFARHRRGKHCGRIDLRDQCRQCQCGGIRICCEQVGMRIEKVTKSLKTMAWS